MHEQLNWDDLRYFLAAAQHGGFGAAARALETQQSTVSRRVASLEQRLGGVLFDRTATGLALTSLGEQVRGEAETMAGALTRMTDLATLDERTVEGPVRIALTETLADLLVIPYVLPELLAHHPRLRIDLVVSSASADLSRREAELALRFFLMPSGDLLTRRLARLEMGVLAKPTLAHKLARTPLAAWPFVSVWLPGAVIPEEAWRRRHAPGDARLSTNSFNAQVAAVKSGLGVAVLPNLLGRELGLKQCALPASVSPPEPLDLYLVTPRALRKVPRVAAVHAALVSAFARFA